MPLDPPYDSRRLALTEAHVQMDYAFGRIINFIEAPSAINIIAPFPSVILSSGNSPPLTLCR